jgi:Fe-S cluster assembly protein SufD
MNAVESPATKPQLEGLIAEAYRTTAVQPNGLPDTLSALREQGFESFIQAGLPSSKDEAWKYTNISKALSLPLEITAAASVDEVQHRDVQPFLLNELDADTVVLLDGHIVPHLTRVSSDSVSVQSICEAVKDESVRSHYGSYADIQNNSFAALNTAFARDGVALRIARGTESEKAVHIVNLTSGRNRLIQPRILVIAEADSALTVVESHHVTSDGRVFANSVAEIFLGARARVDYYRLQDGGDKFSAVSNTNFYQEEGSHASCTTVTLSGDMIRNNVVMHPDGEHCESHLFGLFLGQENLHIDSHTLVDHARPNCYSNELYKGVLDGTSTGVFNGRVLVRRDAQQTNAYQSNKSIVLSDGATMNAKPELEIYADDVKCSHGATTGRLDDEAMFYLRSRGLTARQARTMLLLAFVRDVIENVRWAALREHLDVLLQSRLADIGSHRT